MNGSFCVSSHTWQDYLERSRAPFPLIKEHVLLPYAAALPAADARLGALLTEERLAAIVALIPDAWLTADHTGTSFASPAAQRDAYLRYLTSRLRAPRAFAEEAAHARAQLV